MHLIQEQQRQPQTHAKLLLHMRIVLDQERRVRMSQSQKQPLKMCHPGAAQGALHTAKTITANAFDAEQERRGRMQQELYQRGLE